tara:strand:- start:388 stop:612 length:225 start_codon:yes stop_codon:yes gene_type:complete
MSDAKWTAIGWTGVFFACATVGATSSYSTQERFAREAEALAERDAKIASACFESGVSSGNTVSYDPETMTCTLE